MAKIFLSFYNSIKDDNNKHAMPCFYESLIEELGKVGNDLLIFPHRKMCCEWERIPEKVLKYIKDWDPELIILFNNNFYDVAKDFSCPIIVYEVDSPLLYSNSQNLKQNGNRYKFVVPQIDSINTLEDKYGVDKKTYYMYRFLHL